MRSTSSAAMGRLYCPSSFLMSRHQPDGRAAATGRRQGERPGIHDAPTPERGRRRHAGSTWDPAAYARFSGERSRPFADLVAQVRTEDPALVVDLGCGHGPRPLTLAQLWPDARVVGVDASEAMLESARELDREHRVEWVQADLREWDASLGQAPDVVVTSSTLRWVRPPRPARLLGGGARRRWVVRPPGAGQLRRPEPPADARDRGAPRAGGRARCRARPAGGRRAGHVPALPDPARLHGRRVGDDVPAPCSTPTTRRRTPCWAGWPRPDCGRSSTSSPTTRSAPRSSTRTAALAEAYPRTSAGVLFPFRRVFAVARRRGGPWRSAVGGQRRLGLEPGPARSTRG